MNCNTFRKKMYDYLENNVVLDMKEAMDAHIVECEACRSIYEEEKSIDDAFREAFEITATDFTSSRTAVIKNIDSNRYTSNPVKKVKYHVRKHRVRYLASAAVLIFAFFAAPYIANINGHSYSSKSSADLNKSGGKQKNNIASRGTEVEKSDAQSSTMADNSLKESENSIRSMDVTEGTKMSQTKYMPRFASKDIDYRTEPEYGTPWKPSPHNRYVVSIDGRGSDGTEEAIGKIVVMDREKNAGKQIELIDNDMQYTPMFAEWADEENILVIVGYGQGTVAAGGNVYLVNINTCKTTVIYETSSVNEQVTSLRKRNNVLELDVRVYKDNQQNEYYTEQRTIIFNEVSNRNLPEIKVAYDFASSINSAAYNKALSFMTEGFAQSHQSRIGSINNFKIMDIQKVFDITNQYMVGNSIRKLYDYRVYCAQVAYKTENNLDNTIKSGVYYQEIVTVKQTKDSAWRIADIITIPQS